MVNSTPPFPPVTSWASPLAHVAKAIWDSLMDEFLPEPKAVDWQEIALGFKERWNFPNYVVEQWMGSMW